MLKRLTKRTFFVAGAGAVFGCGLTLGSQRVIRDARNPKFMIAFGSWVKDPENARDIDIFYHGYTKAEAEHEIKTKLHTGTKPLDLHEPISAGSLNPLAVGYISIPVPCNSKESPEKITKWIVKPGDTPLPGLFETFAKALIPGAVYCPRVIVEERNNSLNGILRSKNISTKNKINRIKEIIDSRGGLLINVEKSTLPDQIRWKDYTESAISLVNTVSKHCSEEFKTICDEIPHGSIIYGLGTGKIHPNLKNSILIKKDSVEIDSVVYEKDSAAKLLS